MIQRTLFTSRRKRNQSVRAASANVAWYRRATMLGIIAMAGVASYYVFPSVVSGWTMIEHVSISGVKLMKRGEILSLLALPPEESLWGIHPSMLEARLKAHPRIASASVGRALPHTLVNYLWIKKVWCCRLLQMTPLQGCPYSLGFQLSDCWRESPLYGNGLGWG